MAHTGAIPEHVLDVSGMKTSAFGPRSISWWATIGIVVIEGFMLALCYVTYFYLRTVVTDWPPTPVKQPDLAIPTVVIVAHLLFLPLLLWLDKSAHAFDVPRIRRGLIIASVYGAGLLVLRCFEFRALNVLWSENAYGSIFWTILGLHTFHISGELFETIAMTVLILRGHTISSHLVNVSESCIFWYFIIGIWTVAYPILYLVPWYL